jgi:hypothetical protein
VSELLNLVTPAADVGPQDPSRAAPPRPTGSVRRTSSVDIIRPDGPVAGATVLVDGRARDAVTVDLDTLPICAEQRIQATLDAYQQLTAIAADPPEPALASLVGSHATTGFRARVAAAVPDDRREASLLYLLLDDLPVAALVSGYALQRAGAVGTAPRSAFDPVVGLCSGWAADATIVRLIDQRGAPPMTLGPPAPELASADDPKGWHELPEARPHTVRRRRRIDLTGGATLTVDAMFRDSYFDGDGTESAVHEYGLQAEIDAETLLLTHLHATPRVLPYVECPAAAASATRLVGFHLTDVRDRVRAELVGTSTCTHLNDLLRSLEDVNGLRRAWDRATLQS